MATKPPPSECTPVQSLYFTGQLVRIAADKAAEASLQESLKGDTHDSDLVTLLGIVEERIDRLIEELDPIEFHDVEQWAKLKERLGASKSS